MKLNLKDIYYQIYIVEEDRQKTIFYIRYRYFKYLVMSFRLINASISFQGYINKALKGLLNYIYIVYIDDIFIFSKDEEEHINYIQLVLKRLKEYSLYVKLSKCKFFEHKVNFLRYYVGVNNVLMDPKRV